MSDTTTETDKYETLQLGLRDTSNVYNVLSDPRSDGSKKSRRQWYKYSLVITSAIVACLISAATSAGISYVVASTVTKKAMQGPPGTVGPRISTAIGATQSTGRPGTIGRTDATEETGAKLTTEMSTGIPDPTDACANGGTNRWITVNDYHAKGGQPETSAQTLDECRQICITTTGCNAIDFDNNSGTTKCWIFINVQNPELLSLDGIVHETLEMCVLPTTRV